MSTDDAAELRRQKILRNKERRLELLLGIKNSNGDTDLPSINLMSCSSETTHFSSTLPSKTETVTLLENGSSISSNSSTVRRASVSIGTNTSTTWLKQTKVAAAANTSTVNKTPLDSSNESILTRCRFTGNSNLEVLINFLIAFTTTLLFYFQKSDIIYHNVLLPFATFELAHLIFHFKCLPSTSSQFQMFVTLLTVCGIPQTSLKNLMTTLNFLFILIDNFVIYMFCFILSSMLVHLSSLMYATINV